MRALDVHGHPDRFVCMVIGLGIDLVSIERFEGFLARRGDPALRRLFAEAELAGYAGSPRSGERLAVRFAAKEAFFKAVGLGWGRGGRWSEVAVLRGDAGQPRLALSGRADRQARSLGVHRAHVSLSHGAGTAAAVVVLEG